MIFGNGFDEALWYMLKADRKNRKRIVEFIKGIPEELLEEIKSAVEQYQKWKKEGYVDGVWNPQTDFKVISGTADKSLNEYYNFYLYGNGTLSFYKSTGSKKEEDELFDLELFDINNPSEIETLDGEELLGTITTAVKHYNSDDTISSECVLREYELIRTPLGYMVVFTKENARILKERGKFVSTKSVPDNLTMQDLKTLTKRNVFAKKENN